MPLKAPVRATKVYARVTGGYRQYWCPDCGHFNHIKAPVWQVLTLIACRSCGATFYWGSTFYRPANSASIGSPSDVIAPQFADVALRPVAKHEPINALRQLNADGVTWTAIDHDSE